MPVDLALARAYAPAMSTPRVRRYICGLCGRSFVAAGFEAENLPLEARLCSACLMLPSPPREPGAEDDWDEGDDDDEAGASAA